MAGTDRVALPWNFIGQGENLTRIIVVLLLLLGAQFSLTEFAPAAAGKAWLLWPFAADSKPVLRGMGGLPQQSGSIFTPLLAAAAGLLGWVVPATWWSWLAAGSAVASAVLFVLNFGVWALFPLAVDLALLWGVLGQHWTVGSLRGT